MSEKINWFEVFWGILNFIRLIAEMMVRTIIVIVVVYIAYQMLSLNSKQYLLSGNIIFAIFILLFVMNPWISSVEKHWREIREAKVNEAKEKE
jgi:membrane protein implicated in regulation of membrane protease activity